MENDARQTPLKNLTFVSYQYPATASQISTGMGLVSLT